MTLYELMNGTTVQGKVRISKWVGDDEVFVAEIESDDLAYEDVDDVEDLEVRFLFCATDGMLHIELDGDE